MEEDNSAISPPLVTPVPLRAKMSDKKAVMEQLMGEGVKYIFGNPGSTEQAFMVSL